MLIALSLAIFSTLLLSELYDQDFSHLRNKSNRDQLTRR